MPQSNSGSLTQECHLRCVKDEDVFVLIAESGCQLVGGVLRAELPSNKDRLSFCITDFEAGDERYEIQAASGIGVDPTLESWITPASGKHWSPAIVRDPQVPPTETSTIEVSIHLEIRGPVVANTTTAPVPAGVIKPPTTVVIRSRLGDPS